jgi:hypothetical protein
MRHHGDVPSRPLTRAEVAELADRLRGLLDMVNEDKLSATTAMTYRIQGAVTALDGVMGKDTTLVELLDASARS